MRYGNPFLRPKTNELALVAECASAVQLAAQRAIVRGRSYRHKRTGAACLAVRDVAHGRVCQIFDGANRKMFREYNPDDRRCSEMEAWDDAFNEGYERLLLLYVYAPPQPDDITGLDFGALVSCGHCRNDGRALMQLGKLITESTLCVYENANTGKTLHMSWGELLSNCGGDDDPAIANLPHRFRSLRPHLFAA